MESIMSPENYHVLDYVDDYLHESVTPEYAAYLDRHVEQCSICKAALDEARRRFAALEAVPTAEASEQLIQATVRRVETFETQRVRRRRILTWSSLSGLAASVLVLACLHFYYWQMSPTPYDVLVLGQNQLYAAAPGSVRVRVINHATGEALANVPVILELHGRAPAQVAKLAEFKTNAQGTGQPVMQLPDWPDGSYELRVIAEPGRGREVLSQTITLKRSWKLMLSTDKPIYQPGQLIHLRSLALLQPNLKPVAGHDTVFTVTDPKGNVIFKKKDVTSEHGIAATDCQLATEIAEGPYTIACKIGDTESKRTVEVKKYVLPAFGIQVVGLEPYYRPGQKVTGKVQANYNAGDRPVAEAEVVLKVLTTDAGPNQVREIKAQTDAKGSAAFDFKLPDTLVGRPQHSGDARFGLEILVRDPAGQKQTKLVTKVVTSEPLKLEVIPEGGTLVQGVANKVYLFATYADGQPAAKVRIAITGHDKELTTNKLGVASFDVTPAQPQVALTIRAADNEHPPLSKEVTLACGQPQRDFIIRTDQAVYGDKEDDKKKEGSTRTVHLLAVGGGVEPVFVDFIKDGQTILTQSIDMKSGQGTYQFDLPPDIFGTIELCAYRFGPDGVPVRKTRLIYVRPANEIRIDVAMDRQEYRPGKKATLNFVLTGADNKPAPGVISLAAVDKAVFNLLDQAPGMEKTFYLLEQQLLEPVYAIYPAWMPDGPASVPPEVRQELEQARQELNQAVFARTARTVAAAPDAAPAVPPRAGRRGPRAPMPVAEDAPAVPRMELGRSPHTLQAESFPAKVQEVTATRARGLKWATIGWVGLGLTVLFAGYLVLWLAAPRGMLIAHAIGVPTVFCIGFMSLVMFSGAKYSMDAPARLAKAAAKADWADNEAGAVDTEMPLKAEPRMPRPLEEKPEGGAPAGADEAAEPVRVREWFPETLLWKPELVTDKDGKVSLSVDLADSITDWRLAVSAVTKDGRLGALENSHIRVFQPFFVNPDLPVALTRGDEVTIPVAVYNYLNKEQTVTLKLADAPWFERLDDAVKSLTLPANAVRGASFRVRVTKVGSHPLEIAAEGAGVADAIKKVVEVVPDGRRVETVANGNLQQPLNLSLTVPANAIEGSPKAIVKIYPSTFSQLVEGLDGIFQMPYGCFEQTSSTTYPNVLALDYLERTKKKSPEVEAKARQYINLGYQRLIGFEVSGGGFDWFGRPPANRTLTAYGLMEFQDMARVYNVDPQLIARTRQWLLAQRKPDGSWPSDRGMLNDGLASSVQKGDAELSTTAYIAWAVFGSQAAGSEAASTRDYLLSRRPEAIKDPHTLALVCNALLGMKADSAVAPYLTRLESIKHVSQDGKQMWWEQAPGAQTTFYGSGRSGSVETTSLATLALLEGKQFPATSRAALTWIAAQKDGSGTWHSTQATVLALKALLAGTGASLGGDKERRIEIVLGQKRQQIVIPADQSDVMKQLDLSADLVEGNNALTVTETTDTGAGYQVAFRYHVPEAPVAREQPLEITIDYDKTELAVGDVVIATATVTNRMATTAPMVILDLPIPAGFEITADQLAELVGSKKIEKYQIGARKAVVYLRGLEPNKPLVLRYDLRAKTPVKVSVPAARVYEYYNPDKQAVSNSRQMTVTAR
jgi:hypothetical protein